MNTMQILCVILLSSAFMTLIILIRSALLKTTRRDFEAEIYFVLSGVKKASDLEQIMRSLIRHRSRINCPSTIVIVDDGLSYELRRMAEIYAEENYFIEIV